MGMSTAETNNAKIKCRGRRNTLERHKGKQGGNDGLEHADLLGKEHAERHANRNDDLHVPREKLAQSNPLLHMLL